MLRVKLFCGAKIQPSLLQRYIPTPLFFAFEDEIFFSWRRNFFTMKEFFQSEIIISG
jgi:hypothetical protein